MKSLLCTLAIVLVAGMPASRAGQSRETPALNVVTTLPDYAFFVEELGGGRVAATSIVRGDQDAHFIRPKPSFSAALRNADVLVATGLDLELWVQAVIDNSGNGSVRSGQKGYVSAATGMNLLEKPKTVSRAGGGVHIYGNPHVTCSPVLMKTAARNIASALVKNDPAGREIYMKNLEELNLEIDRRLFGAELVEMLGADTLCSLAEQDRLIPFLREHEFKGKPLVEYLGGWMKKMLPLRGAPIVTYHKNWVYFARLFGLEEAATVEPKPGIPPSPKHVAGLINLMRQRNIGIILAANYFDEQKIRTVAARTNAEAVIVPLYVGGAEGAGDYFKLVDYWTDAIVTAARKKGLLAD
jgi:ABC-type Zn uptake system ZnuABC Zn-binding protein ZnuA